MLDVVSRARSKLIVSDEKEGCAEEFGGVAASEKKFSAVYAIPAAQKKRGQRHNSSKVSPFKPLTMDEMLKSLNGRVGFTKSPFSMEPPSFTSSTNQKGYTDQTKENFTNAMPPGEKEFVVELQVQTASAENCVSDSDSDNGSDDEALGYENLLNSECERLRDMLAKKIESSENITVKADVVENAGDDANSLSDKRDGNPDRGPNTNELVVAASDAFSSYINSQNQNPIGSESEIIEDCVNNDLFGKYLEEHNDCGDDEDLFTDDVLADYASMEKEYGAQSFQVYEQELTLPF